MIKLIRNEMFETNSSSTHSIVVSYTNDRLLDTLPLDVNGDVLLEGGEFGWEYAVYRDALTKANYLALYTVQYYPNDVNLAGENLVDLLVRVIKDQTQCNNVIFNFHNNAANYSYIDHQSIEDKNYHWLFNETDDVRAFIFNKDSYLETDNDNH